MKAFLGIDVGLSSQNPTTGFCLMTTDNSSVRFKLEISTWDNTKEVLRALLKNCHRLEAIAVDGPLAKGLQLNKQYRSAEAALSRGKFQRCKPGATNSPVGQELHKEATEVARMVSAPAARRSDNVASDGPEPEVTKGNVYEAFPNAFLGVLLSDEFLAKKFKRNEKSDRFYEQSFREKYLTKLITYLLPHHAVVGNLGDVTNHDERAAAACALTAISINVGRFVAVGDPDLGYIFLPPWELWQNWAKETLKNQLAGLVQDFPSFEIWRDGRRWERHG